MVESFSREAANSAHDAYSASLVFAGMNVTWPTPPIFSYDSGLLFKPSAIETRCLYGIDAATEAAGSCQHEHGPSFCEPSSLRGLDPHNRSHDRSACGFHPTHGWRDTNPWRVADAQTMLAYQAQRGPGSNLSHASWTSSPPGKTALQYKWSYNEVIVRPWSEHAVEAIYLVDCQPTEVNHHIPGAPIMGGKVNPLYIPVQRTCAKAHEIGRKVHGHYQRAHRGKSIPLVMLRRRAWDWVYAPPRK